MHGYRMPPAATGHKEPPNALDPDLDADRGRGFAGRVGGRAQRPMKWAPLAIVRSSSRMAGLLLRDSALFSARRVRATCRRFRQLVVTLFMVLPLSSK
ncbi:protein of unknown function [Blastococcus saxobsidens DD2]|uniref:Uncharacterized protein n=1 Tax=Blastococcus saxobsidens (strain DD2) TaxID=1146883 RepID=H6RSB6_BLASD|nr:protein of unknown function [Blastococcus saxobsidens DD2]